MKRIIPLIGLYTAQMFAQTDKPDAQVRSNNDYALIDSRIVTAGYRSSW